MLKILLKCITFVVNISLRIIKNKWLHLSKMDKLKKVTIHDIAKSLNITASTVSRSLSNHPRISEETKNLVLNAAKALNYKPNNVASALRNGKTQTIGMLVPIIDRAFFSSIIRGVEQVSNEFNYHVIISQSDEIYNSEKQAIRAFLNARVDGVIASIGKSTTEFRHYQEVIDSGIPLILFDRTTNLLNTNKVVIDDYQGGYLATKHLLEQGCSRIVHLTSSIEIDIYKERYRGYTDALKDYKVELDKSFVFKGNLQLTDGRNHALELVESKVQFDAVFSASDYAAIGCMQVLKENNFKIPQDVAIVGFSNEPVASFTDPTLSSINQFPLEIGRTVAKLFFKELESNSKTDRPNKTVIQPELVVRQSSNRI